MKPRPSTTQALCLTTLTSLLWLGSNANTRAAGFTWDGGGSDDLSTTPENWDPDGAPSPRPVLIFSVPSPAQTTATWVSGNLRGLDFNADAPSMVVSASPGFFQFDAGGAQSPTNNNGLIMIRNLGPNTQTIDSEVRVFNVLNQAARYFRANGPLQLNDNVFYRHDGAKNIALILDGSSTGTIAGNVSQTNPADGNATLIKSGTSTWEIQGTTVIDNELRVDSGTIRLNGGTAPNVLHNGGTLEFASGNFTISGNVTQGGRPSVATLLKSGTDICEIQGTLANNNLVQVDGGTLLLNGGITPTVLINDGNLEVASGTFVDSNGGSDWGINNSGSLDVTGGSMTPSFLTRIGNGGTGMATLSVENSTLVNNGELLVGWASPGTLEVGPGALIEGNFVRANNAGGGTDADSVINFNGGTVAARRLSGSGALDGTALGTWNFNGSTLVVKAPNASTAAFMFNLAVTNVQAGGAIIDTDGNNAEVLSTLDHDPALGGTPDGGLTKLGAGCLFLEEANTYTGPTTVEAGFLGGNGSVTSDVTVDAGAGLACVVTDPGGSAGTDWSVLDVTGTLSLPDPLIIKVDSAETSPFPETGGALTVLTTTGGISGFNAATVTFDTAAFTGFGSFAASLDGNNLVITYTAGSADDYDTWGNSVAGWTFGEPNTGKTEDFDGDGVTNDDERIFGLDPTNAGSVNPITATLTTAGDFTYTRRDPSLSGATFTVMTSPDLSTWTEDTGAVSLPSVGDIQSVAVTLTATPVDGKLFVRVEAE